MHVMFVNKGTELESMYTMFELEFDVVQNDTTESRKNQYIYINIKVL